MSSYYDLPNMELNNGASSQQELEGRFMARVAQASPLSIVK